MTIEYRLQSFPPNLSTISDAYSDPPLFSDGEAPQSLDKIILNSLARQGAWDAVSALEEESGLVYDVKKRKACEELYSIVEAIKVGDIGPALE